MAENKVIVDEKPRSYARRLRTNAWVYASLGLFIFIISRRFLILFLIPVAFLFDCLVYELNSDTYEGWRIEGDEIILLKWLVSGLKEKNIMLDSISSISYFDGSGRGGQPRLIFQQDSGKVNCNVYRGPFDLAGTLRFFQSKGINVKLVRPDDEMQLFLDGKIPFVPMTNR